MLPLDSSSINGEDENMEDYCLETENINGCEKPDSLKPNPDGSSEEGNQSWDLTENLSENNVLGSAQCLHPQFLNNQVHEYSYGFSIMD